MIVITGLTVGQITFILRAIIQILSYGGLFLIGYIVLASAPQIASLKTHDVLNRVVGRNTANKSTAKWIFNSLRSRNGDPVTSKRLVISLILLSVYSIFVSISDLGFLGFYACKVSAGSYYDRPRSVNDDNSALAAVNTSLVAGADPSTVKMYRCDAAKADYRGDNITLQTCTSWHNFTLTDTSGFAGINNTDSDMLLPRQLRHMNYTKSATFDLNTYRVFPGPKLIDSPTINNGMVSEPNSIGVRTVFGVPELGPGRSATLPKNMAMEIEVGCMTLGVYSSHDPSASGGGIDYLDERTDKRNYSGPEGLRDVLTQTADEIHNYYSPLFKSDLVNGIRTGINGSSTTFTDIPMINSFYLPDIGAVDGPTRGNEILGNCTQRLKDRLGLGSSDYMISDTDKRTPMCSLLLLSGSEPNNGDYLLLATKMVCASTTQINMVSGTVNKDQSGQVTLNVTRLPSDLHQLRADYVDIVPSGNDTIYNLMQPILRYTLSDNPNGNTSHYIHQAAQYMRTPMRGPGSPGDAISQIGTTVMDLGDLLLANEFSYVTVLNGQNFSMSPATVTKWGGTYGASLVLNSVTYNGFVAKQVEPVLVTDIDGKDATCYRSPYAVSFLPLVLAAIFIVCWIVFLFVVRGLSGTKQVEEYYGGLKPYWGVVCPTTAAQSALLSWESYPGPHLALVPPGQPISVRNSNATAARHLSSSSSSEPSKSAYA
ncbi:hypothetical protein E1B28_011257 [Marasmius oreades]|uniref:Uncharacterized protein n=1 Tax=Marasmius oreades TaxID=181124 RepID=A0A9P7RUF4_9AGAR|nr:uncharacterized protein E1B28_011257 [Marasmius oreades]KAG7089590.1 hypothetical protein E1B28_011257 [Marasmius oreades]